MFFNQPESNKMQVILRVFFVSCFFSGFIPVLPQHHGDNTGKVVIRQVPENARIVMNDATVTHAGNAGYDLAPGRYHIIVSNPVRLNARQLDFDTTVIVRSGEITELICRFSETVTIESEPFGTLVFANGVKIGETPLRMDYRGATDLLFVKKGYDETTARLDDSGFKDGRFFVALKKSTSAAPDNPNLFKNAQWEKRGEKRFRTPLIAVLSLAVLSGSAAAYTKKKADDYFEDAKLAYLFSDFEKQKRLEKKTRRFDRFATMGYIGMQVNMVAAVYFLFRMN